MHQRGALSFSRRTVVKKLTWGLIIASSILLAACGGGGGADATAVVPTPVSAPPPAPTPDVVITQRDTTVVATPGETIRATVLTVACKDVIPGTSQCQKAMTLGELGMDVSGIDLQDGQFLHDGQPMNGYVSRQGSLYRFVPTAYNGVWQQGSFELMETVSPLAKDGDSSPVTVQIADASIDQTLGVVPGNALIKIVALPEYAPAMVTASGDPVKGVTSALILCRASAGCHPMVRVSFSGAPNAEADVYVNGQQMVQMWTDVNGFAMATFDTGVWSSVGQVTEVKAVAAPRAGQTDSTARFEMIKVMSGAKEIAPILPSDCTPASPNNCKG